MHFTAMEACMIRSLKFGEGNVQVSSSMPHVVQHVGIGKNMFANQCNGTACTIQILMTQTESTSASFKGLAISCYGRHLARGDAPTAA